MKRGFTLIELVMVIVILGILAAMVLPRFIDLQAKAKESAAKGALGAVRSAVAVKYAENAANGVTPLAPTTIEASMFQDNQVPAEPYSDSRQVRVGGSSTVVNGAGGWAYDSANGRVWINSTQYSTY